MENYSVRRATTGSFFAALLDGIRPAISVSSISVVFADVENMPEYGFDLKAFIVTLIIFVLVYELVMYMYSRSIKRLSVKSIMSE